MAQISDESEEDGHDCALNDASDIRGLDTAEHEPKPAPLFLRPIITQARDRPQPSSSKTVRHDQEATETPRPASNPTSAPAPKPAPLHLQPIVTQPRDLCQPSSETAHQEVADETPRPASNPNSASAQPASWMQCDACHSWMKSTSLAVHKKKKCKKLPKKDDAKHWTYVEIDDDDEGDGRHADVQSSSTNPGAGCCGAPREEPDDAAEVRRVDVGADMTDKIGEDHVARRAERVLWPDAAPAKRDTLVRGQFHACLEAQQHGAATDVPSNNNDDAVSFAPTLLPRPTQRSSSSRKLCNNLFSIFILSQLLPRDTVFANNTHAFFAFLTVHYFLILSKVHAHIVAASVDYPFFLGTFAAFVIAICKNDIVYARMLEIMVLCLVTAFVVLGVLDAYYHAPAEATHALRLFADLLGAIAEVERGQAAPV
ncbi:hypothetical protein EXIGLDRAFT_778737 [Exidia glandulosa HHB12029]|uniref:Uncharacterized protein n=1 Tax=Exidia glandulosa HHB12029 TaxID=1314781 RepID=A0A165CE82_EXIGL|nr:hypothetical protein EXIGLDRAFT_778737 [Exidia glandulosa HHB12029]